MEFSSPDTVAEFRDMFAEGKVSNEQIHSDSKATTTNVVTTGIKPSSNIGSALVSAMCRRSSELGLYLWGNPPLPTVQEHPPLVSSGWLPPGG